MCCSEIGYGLQRGWGVGCGLAAPLEIGATWGWVCGRLGVVLEVLGKVVWCYQMIWVFVKVLSGGRGNGVTLGDRRGDTLGTGWGGG